jgi:ribosomal protein S27AE
MTEPEPYLTCPRCGASLWHGFGLAGGGYGPYSSCTSDECDFFTKKQLCPTCDELDCSCPPEAS